MPEYSVNFTDCAPYALPPSFSATDAASIKATHFYDLSGGKGQGLITQSFVSDMNSPYNVNTKKWNNTTSYLLAITGENGTTTGKLLNQINTGATETDLNVSKIDVQTANDKALNARLKAEYCFLRSRYSAYLTAFLDAIKPGSTDTAKQQALLDILVDLNAKINAFSTLLDEYAKTRANIVDARNSALNALNASISRDTTATEPAAKLLANGNAVLNTRNEMIRYTKEKNNSVVNQVSLWAALNIVAIGMIFHLYRTL